MKIKLYKEDLLNATADIKGKVYFPWGWPEMRNFSRLWPDRVPIEVEINDDQVVELDSSNRRHSATRDMSNAKQNAGAPVLGCVGLVGLGPESVEYICSTLLKDSEEARKLEQNQHASDYDRGWNGAISHAFREASDMVRAEMARANQRQPEEVKTPGVAAVAALFGELVRAGTMLVSGEEVTGYVVATPVEELRAVLRLPMYRRVATIEADELTRLRDEREWLQFVVNFVRLPLGIAPDVSNFDREKILAALDAALSSPNVGG